MAKNKNSKTAVSKANMNFGNGKGRNTMNAPLNNAMDNVDQKQGSIKKQENNNNQYR